jgi:hypothetical protein
MTTRRDPERDLDDLLGEGGGEMGNLYRRLPRYEPPRRLDRAVLGEAARAALSGKPPRRQRWIFGLGSAAGLVLAAGIAWRIGHDAMNQDAVPSNAAPMSAPSVVPVEPISESARAKKHEQQAASDDAAAPPAPSPSAEDALRSRSLQDEAKSRAPEKTKAVSRRAQPPPVMTEIQKPAAAPEPASPPQAFPGTAQEREQVQDSEQARDRAAPLAGAAAGADKKRVEQSAARPLPSTTPPSGSVELRRDMQLAPEDWLSHIHQLLSQGRRQQAMESLRLFQRVHPDWQIPDDLRPLLQ